MKRVMTKELAKKRQNKLEAQAGQKYNEAIKEEWEIYKPYRDRWLAFVAPHFQTMMLERSKAMTQFLKDMAEIPSIEEPLK